MQDTRLEVEPEERRWTEPCILWLQQKPTQEQQLPLHPAYRIQYIPVLEFHLIQGVAEKLIKSWLDSSPSQSLAGLILTSPRAIIALNDSLKAALTCQSLSTQISPEAIESIYLNMPLYVVGQKSASLASELGFNRVQYPPPSHLLGQSEGNAEALAEYIICSANTTLSSGESPVHKDQPWLFLSGNRRRDILPTRLRQAGLSLIEWTVYETHPTTRHLEEWVRLSLSRHASTAQGGWIVLCSPSGVETAADVIQTTLKHWKRACIGSTTAKCVQEMLGLSVQAIAATPTPEGIMNAILAYDASLSSSVST